MYMAHERRQYILRLLEQRGSIRSAALALELGVTDETIRTDLVALQRKGLLKRVHGGAEYIVPTTTANTATEHGADSALAAIVAKLLPTGSVIYAEACRFTRVLATQLADKPCTFITASPQLALQLAPEALPHTIICTGGTIDKTTRLCCCNNLKTAFSQTALQWAILRPAGLAPKQAFYHYSTQARWAQAAAQAAAHLILCVPANALYTQAEHAVDLPNYQLVTEDNIPGDFADIPTQTIPYISADTIIPDRSYDY